MPRRMRIRSALSVTKALVAPRWMNLCAAGRDVAEGVDVRHHVVAEPPLVDRHLLEVDVVEVGAHLRQRLVGDRHAERLLGLREGQPEPTPEPVARLRRPELQHRPGGVPLGERRGVAIVRGHRMKKSVGIDLALVLEEDADRAAPRIVIERARHVLRAA